MSNINSPVNSRTARRENRRLEQSQKTSRSKYNRLIQKINDSANKYVFSNRRLKKVIAKRKLLRKNNADEAQATVSKWIWSTLTLIGLVAVTVIDYLIVGGTIDYLLGMQRELQGHEDYFFYLKILCTIALLAIEVSIAVGLILLREYYNSRALTVAHWLVGIGLALSLTAFAFGLVYTKIKTESVNIPVASETISADETATSVAEITDSPIPPQKWVMLIGVCSICFFVHVFALMKADSVSDAFALYGYGAQQTIYSARETVHQIGVNRAAGKTEESYRRAYDHFETHNADFTDTQLPSVPSQQDPHQLIPVMRLSPVAQRIIENLQNGAVENLGVVRNNAANTIPVDNDGAGMNEDQDEHAPPVNDQANNGFGNNGQNGNAAPRNVHNPNDFAGRDNHNNGNYNANHNGNNADNAEAEYLRTVLDAQVRDSDGGL